jgi:rhodanese-related sulfurtransferase
MTLDPVTWGVLALGTAFMVDQLGSRIAELGSKETAIVVYCLSGARSGRAASLLRAQGFTTVADLGPMSRW